MELYEFINMSDTITFYAENDDYARVVTLILGEGKAECKKQNGISLPYCMTAFGNKAPQEIYDHVSNMLKNKDKKLISALKTVAVCNFSEREIFDEYTNNSTNQEKYDKWDDAHRTSLNNFGKYARKIAKSLEKENKSNEH